MSIVGDVAVVRHSSVALGSHDDGGGQQRVAFHNCHLEGARGISAGSELERLAATRSRCQLAWRGDKSKSVAFNGRPPIGILFNTQLAGGPSEIVAAKHAPLEWINGGSRIYMEFIHHDRFHRLPLLLFRSFERQIKRLDA